MAVRPSTKSACPFRRRVDVNADLNDVLEYFEEHVDVVFEILEDVEEDVDVVFEILEVVLADTGFHPLLAIATSVHGLSSSLESSTCASISACGKGSRSEGSA